MATVPERVHAMAEEWPDEVAHRVVGGPSLTFGDWWSRSNRLARGLRDAGVQRGDRVALVFDSPDVITHVISYIAVHKAGAINVLVNKRFGGQEIARLLEHAEPTAVLASGSLRDLLADAGVRDAASVSLFAATDDVDGAQRWEDLLADDDTELGVELADDDPADVLYTSGTTGRPKGVLSRHGNATQASADPPEQFTGSGWLHGSPLESLGGVSFLTTPPGMGMTTVWLPPPFDARAWLEEVDGGSISATMLVPAMVERILEVDDLEGYDLSALDLVTVGSAPIAPATLRRFNQLLPNATPQISYSLTELGTGFTFMPEDEFDDRLDSVGKPMPPLHVRIVDPDSQEELPPGEPGEVQARVEDGSREYFRRPDLNEEEFVDGWLRTGDLGHLDEDGFLYLHGRLDEVIVREGYNVHPADPERAIYEDDRVQSAAVFGIPHEVRGELVVAAVVPRDGADLTAEQVHAHLEERLGEAKRPDRVEILDQLPRNADGKVLKRELSERFG